MTQYGNTLNIQANGIVVSNNGSFTPVTPVNYGVLITNGSGTPSLLAAGTTGQVLTATTSATPSWESPASSSITITGDSGGGLTGNSFTFTGGTTGLTFSGATSTETVGGTLVVANGGTGRASQTAYMPIVGGTTTTAAQQSVATGTVGQVLAYQGASSVPTFVSAILGATAGSFPAAGFMGQNQNSTFTSAAINTVFGNITSLALTAGNYIVSANIAIVGGSFMSLTAVLSTTSGTSLTPFITGGAIQSAASATVGTNLCFPALPLSISSPTTVFLNAGIGASSTIAQGILTVTRIG